MRQSKDRPSPAESRSHLRQKFLLVIIALAFLAACSSDIQAYAPEECGFPQTYIRVSLDWEKGVGLIDQDGEEIFSAFPIQTTEGDRVAIDQPGNGDDVSGFLDMTEGDSETVDGYVFTVDQVDGNDVVIEVALDGCEIEE